MHGTNKRARPASHHAKTQPPVFALLFGFSRHVWSPFVPQAPAFAGWLPRPHRILQNRRTRARRFCKIRSEEHTSELQSRLHLVCRLLLEKKKNQIATRRYRATRNSS